VQVNQFSESVSRPVLSMYVCMYVTLFAISAASVSGHTTQERLGTSENNSYRSRNGKFPQTHAMSSCTSKCKDRPVTQLLGLRVFLVENFGRAKI
jgi:hypothetical protein